LFVDQGGLPLRKDQHPGNQVHFIGDGVQIPHQGQRLVDVALVGVGEFGHFGMELGITPSTGSRIRMWTWPMAWY